jgi:DNA-binding transcriptional ArsR family regulator
MAEQNIALLTAKAKILKALGHPTRLYIVEELAGGEKCVCQFVEVIDADFSTVSKHLSVLKEAGIVQDRKKGQMVIYSLKVPCIIDFIGCIEAVIRNSIAEQTAMLG